MTTVFLNTAVLAVSVGVGTFILGVILAWWVSFYRFPGHKFFSWALMLPMAIPGYVMAFTLPLRGGMGTIIVMTLALYPYMFMMTKRAFLSQGPRCLEVAKTLGMSPLKAFWRAGLPMAWPWIGAAALLILMDVLADFGTVSVMNYDTFTTAIYQAWFGFFSIQEAIKLSMNLLILVLLLLLLEQWFKRRRRYTPIERAEGNAHLQDSRFSPLMSLGAAATLFAGFAWPVGQLLLWVESGSPVRPALVSVGLATLGAMVIVCLAWYFKRIGKVLGLGYALPGTVLAVILYRYLSPLQIPLLMMMIAYVIRFFAVADKVIQSGRSRLRKGLDDAAKTLGKSSSEIRQKIHFPLMLPSLKVAYILVFVELIKELPITLMTRPFGWDTLSVKVFEFTSEGLWEIAALPSLLIVLVGLLPIKWLNA